MATPIGTLGTIPTLTVGGRVFTDLTTLIILGGYALSNNSFASLRKPNGSAAYSITTAKTYTIYAAKLIGYTLGGTGYINVLYGDTDAGMDAASAPTNAVYCNGDAATRYAGVGASSTGTGYFLDGSHTPFAVPAGKYVASKFLNGGGTAFVYGYEV